MDLEVALLGAFHAIHGFLGVALFQPGQGQVVVGRAERRLQFDGPLAQGDAFIQAAQHILGGGQRGHGLNELGVPLQGFGESLHGLFGFAALQVHIADVAPGDGETRPIVWRFAAPAGGWAGNL